MIPRIKHPTVFLVKQVGSHWIACDAAFTPVLFGVDTSQVRGRGKTADAAIRDWKEQARRHIRHQSKRKAA